MIEEDCMHRLTQCVLSPECKREIAYAAARTRTRQIILHPSYSLYEVNTIAGMFFKPCCYSHYVYVEDDVVSLKTTLFGQ